MSKEATGDFAVMRDADVRSAIKRRLFAQHRDDPATRIVEEMGVWSGTVRIDIAVINGELSGFELKSDSDTLERLPNQVEMYGKVFDRMTLVVGSKHYEKALSRIPPWWGCILATMDGGRMTLRTKRKTRRNPTPDPAILAQLLWREEAVLALEKHGLAQGWRSKRSADIVDRLLSNLSYQQLADEVRHALKVRPKLGQLAARQLNVPIDTVCDPSCWTAG